MAVKRNKIAQVNLRIDPELKEAAEAAAEADHRSLTSLIEKLLIDHIAERKGRGRRTAPASASRAAELAGETIDRLSDKGAPADERAVRKRRLVKGPKEFR